MKSYIQYIREQIELSPVLKIAKQQGKPYDQITKLNCSDNQLTSLEGIENLVNLQQLSCYRNQLNNLEGIENLVNLQQLYCSVNKLTSLRGIENIVNLQRLYCYNNQLTSLELGDFSIEAFELGIDETDLRRFKKLEELSCAENKFSNRYKEYLREYCKRKGVNLSI